MGSIVQRDIKDESTIRQLGSIIINAEPRVTEIPDDAAEVFGIIGKTVKGPINTPTVCENKEQFYQIFGGRSFAEGTINTTENVSDVYTALLGKNSGRFVVCRAYGGGAMAGDTTPVNVLFGDNDTSDPRTIQISAKNAGVYGRDIETATNIDGSGIITIDISFEGNTYKLTGSTTAEFEMEVQRSGAPVDIVVVGAPAQADLQDEITSLKKIGLLVGDATTEKYVATGPVETIGLTVDPDYDDDRFVLALDAIKNYKEISVITNAGRVYQRTDVVAHHIPARMAQASLDSSDKMFITSLEHDPTTFGEEELAVKAMLAIPVFTTRDMDGSYLTNLVVCSNRFFVTDQSDGAIYNRPSSEVMLNCFLNTRADQDVASQEAATAYQQIARLKIMDYTNQNLIYFGESGMCPLDSVSELNSYRFRQSVTSANSENTISLLQDTRIIHAIVVDVIGRLAPFYKQDGSKENRMGIKGAISSYGKELISSNTYINEQGPVQFTGTEQEISAGIFRISWEVRLKRAIDSIVLNINPTHSSVTVEGS